MDRRKLSPCPIERGTRPRPLASSHTSGSGGYASVLERARALGLGAALMLAPLGLAGSVAACGGARPVEANGQYMQGPTGYAGHPPPIATIAPPPASAAPGTPQQLSPPQETPESE